MGDWRHEATCKDISVDSPLSFFSDENGEMSLSMIQKVRNRYCNRCPVQEECLSFGRETGSEGIWGGVYISYQESKGENNG